MLMVCDMEVEGFRALPDITYCSAEQCMALCGCSSRRGYVQEHVWLQEQAWLRSGVWAAACSACFCLARMHAAVAEHVSVCFAVPMCVPPVGDSAGGCRQQRGEARRTEVCSSINRPGCLPAADRVQKEGGTNLCWQQGYRSTPVSFNSCWFAQT